MYKYLVFRIPNENDEETHQIFSSNNYHSALSWLISSARGSDDEFVIVDQSGVADFRQALH